MNDLDKIPCGYLQLRDDGTLLHCNEMLAAWVGLNKRELVGKSIESIFTLSTRIFYNTHFFPLVKLHGKASEIYMALKGPDNSDIPVLANATRSDEAEGPVIHCILVQVGQRTKYEQELLNARRTAEQALQENEHLHALTESLEKQALILDQQFQRQVSTNENLVQFNRIISHDFQEPIRKIQLFADRISRRLPEESPLTSDCLKIDLAARKLRTLAASLLQYVAVDEEKYYSDVHLAELIFSAKARAINQREFSDFDIQVDTLPTVKGYASQLDLMFFHLIDNAIQFRHPARRLQISIQSVVVHENIFKMTKDQYRYSEHVKIRFSDNGIGIPDAYKEYVFQLLKKMDISGKGVGLGLPLVKKIVNNHSGTISVESKTDEGTTFEILLPVRLSQ